MNVEVAFHILGIEETLEEERIQSAYRKKLKENNPEENPEGFKELRQAYDTAKQFIYQEKKQSRAHTEEMENKISDSPYICEWFHQVEDIYCNLLRRRENKEWEQVFENPVCQEIDTSIEVRQIFLVFLINHYHFPHAVWKLIDSCFTIVEDYEELKQLIPPNFLDYMVYYIQNKNFLPYEKFSMRDEFMEEEEFLGKMGENQADEYINRLLTVKSVVDQKQYSECENQLEQLQVYCLYHPYEDVEWLRYYVAEGNLEKAKEKAELLYEQYPEDYYIKQYCGVVFSQFGEEEKAVAMWKQVLEEQPESFEALYQLAQYYFAKEDYLASKEYVLDILENDGENEEMVKLLSQINEKLIQLYQQGLEKGQDVLKYKCEELPQEMGWCYLQEKNYQKAYDLLMEYGVTPCNTVGYYQLCSYVLYQLERYEECVPYIESWLEELGKLQDDGTKEVKRKLSRKPNALFLYGFCLGKSNQLPQAEKILNSARKEYQDTEEEFSFFDCLAQVYIEHEEYEKAVDICDNALKKNSRFFPFYVYRMEAFLKSNRPQEVIEDYHQAIAIYPGYYKPYLFAMEVLQEYEQYEDVLKIADVARTNQIQQSPKMKMIYAMALRGSAKDSEGVEAALKLLEELVVAPRNKKWDIESNGLLFLELAFGYWDLDQLEKAYENIQKAMEREPENHRYQMIAGDMLSGQNRHREAMEMYELAKEEYQQGPAYHYRMGRCYENLSELGDALVFYEKALEYQEDYMDCHERISEIARKVYGYSGYAKWYKLAIKHADRMIEQKENCYTRVHRGLIHMDAFEIAKAMEDFEKALEYQPLDWAAWNNLGCCYKYLGEFEKGVECLKKAVEYMKEGETDLPYSNMADCYESLQQYGQALACYKKNMALFGENGKGIAAKYEAANMYKYLGDYASAYGMVESMPQNIVYEYECYLDLATYFGKKFTAYMILRKINALTESELTYEKLNRVGEILLRNYSYSKKYRQIALAYLKKAVTKEANAPDIMKSYIYCTMLSYTNQKFKEATEYAKKANEIFMDMNSGHSEEEYLEFGPLRPKRLGMLGWMHLALGREEKALEYFRQMTQCVRCKLCRHKECYRSYLYMARYCQAKGEKKKAKEYYKKAAKINPQHMGAVKSL